MKPFIFPYKMTSNSARFLARELNCRRIYPDGRSKYIPKASHLIINWGSSTLPYWDTAYGEVLNHCDDVLVASNKLKTFHALDVDGFKENIPEYTIYKAIAKRWVENGIKVYCRTSLTSSKGRGIIIASSVEELVDAPLYVKQAKITDEFRVHVFDGVVIDYTKKARRDNERPSKDIRNHDNGWVFVRNQTREGVISIIPLPINIHEAAIEAVKLLGLDFGAVDIGWNNNTQQVTIFEINTAPGLHLGGTTLKAYANAIREVL